MGNDIATTYMWDSAVTDTDAVARDSIVVRAKVALAGAWPFLAAAQNEEEFGHRLALIAEQIEQRVPETVREEVVASLRRDFDTVHTARLERTASMRKSARAIAKVEGDESLPQAYVHVHKHAGDSAEDSTYQVDHIGSPTFLQTVGHFGDHDTAINAARQYALPNGLPLYENGRYVEGKRLASVEAGMEYFDAERGMWMQAKSQMSDDDHVAAYHAWATQAGHNPDDLATLKLYEKNVPGIGRSRADKIADVYHSEDTSWRQRKASRPFLATRFAPGNYVQHGNDWHLIQRVFDHGEHGTELRVEGGNVKYVAPGEQVNVATPQELGKTAKGNEIANAKGQVSCSCGKTVFHNGGGAKRCPQCGDHLPGHAAPGPKQAANYQPDPNAAWRYHYPDPPQATAQGGQPTAPSPNGATGLVQPVGQTSVGPDGFPIDYAQGEYNGAAAKIQEQITPGAWTVNPGSEWPTRPNAGSFDQTPVYASRTPAWVRDWSQTHGAIANQAHARGEHRVTASLVCPTCNPAPKVAYRVTAGEGIVPTPGPNPNYFSQGTQGLAGPPSFPQNPSGEIEPKTDNRVDDVYGAVPPQVSSGSDEGQVDGDGYSRQGVTGRRLGFSRSAGERTAGYSGKSHYEDEPRPGSVFHKASPTAANEARYVHEVSSDSDFDSGFVPDRGGIHVHDYPQAIGELQANWDIHDDNVASGDNEGGRNSRKRTEVGKLIKSLKDAHSKQGSARVGYSKYEHDHELGYEHGFAGLPHQDLMPSQGYLDGHAEGAAAGGHEPEEPSRWPERRAGYYRPDPEDIPSRGEIAREQDPDWERDHAPDPRYQGWTPEQRAAEMQRQLDQLGKPPKQASTNGRIVGLCDHCNAPVRYHDDGGGHLRHLHNDSPKCQDGKTASFRSTQFFNITANADMFRAIPRERGGQCSFCDKSASHDLAQISHGQPYKIGDACHVHAKEYDGKQVMGVRAEREARGLDPITGAVLENPTAENPTGKGGDPYRAKTSWEGFEHQRERQKLEGDGGMNANTPTTAPEPIKTGPNQNTPGGDLDSDGPRERGDDDEDNDDE